jgi:3-methyladenine DNA glycosylase AlkC
MRLPQALRARHRQSFPFDLFPVQTAQEAIKRFFVIQKVRKTLNDRVCACLNMLLRIQAAAEKSSAKEARK